jgi:hypothetical protein
VTKIGGEQGREFDVTLAKRVVTNLDTTLLEQPLDVSVTEREAVVQPTGVLDDADWKSVAVRLSVSHCIPPYRLTCQNHSD